MISVKAGTWDRTYGATQSHSLCSVSDIPTPPGRWQVEHLAPGGGGENRVAQKQALAGAAVARARRKEKL